MGSKYFQGVMMRYAAGVAGIIVTFGNFVACGSQLYQVSVKEDFSPSEQVKAANPEMENPDSTLYGIHAPSGWKELPIRFQFGKDMNQEQKVHFLAAIKTWEWAVGKNLFEYLGTHEQTNGDTFVDLYSSLTDEVNGQYLDANWVKTKKPNYVLATTIWNNGPDYSLITKADIRFNEEHYIIGNSLTNFATDTKEVVDMQSLALHELGHFLGLAHVDAEVDSLSIMNPSLFIGEGLTSRRLSRGDIDRIQLVYGCEGNSCDVDALLEEAEDMYSNEAFEKTAALWLDSNAPSLRAH
ncbi:matrixin family metalloprotease [Pseudobacteriovorax antillogorgiicola]|uniref:Matrixin n=1 Tax=Pseudobacteriovorax antillogorgiicola TaxID=1513793 RepID=A0A1Y6B8S5_9BACT|nr:matrixin family metalloprotease [Pseudobacteriovorax antillogorgiicola]TCS59219.1 matrixin [Pseudobacteriovorax antillogorgiicola]SME90396.1 Matrixin [Pseudobacteriovorax antillogorgiicola]